MSNAVFPALPGLAWPVGKNPEWSTSVQKSASGRELRAAFFSYPRWRFRLSFEVLTQADLATLAGFFNARQGSFDNFLFLDPIDNSVTDQAFGLGDGQNTKFQLARNYGGVVEPVFGAVASPAIYLTDWRGKSLQYTTPRTNLLKYSAQFDNAIWAKTRASITANATTAPDGTVTADKLVIDATAASTHYDYQSTLGSYTPGNWVTFSRYVKAGEFDQVYLQFSTSGGAFTANLGANLDLTTGAASLVSSGVTATAVNIGSGWWRCSISAQATGTGSARVVTYIASSTGTSTGRTTIATADGVSGIYLWGAQFEANNGTTPYIPTTSASVTVTDYAIDSNAAVTFVAPPAIGVPLTWTGQYYFRCRFVQDSSEFEQFMSNLWNLKKLEIITDKL